MTCVSCGRGFLPGEPVTRDGMSHIWCQERDEAVHWLIENLPLLKALVKFEYQFPVKGTPEYEAQFKEGDTD